MPTKKELIGNELVKEILSIRIDTLWRMLKLKERGELPKPEEEGATGEFDNKGALFVPGGLIFCDSDKAPIKRETSGFPNPKEFRKLVRESMKYDNAVLLYPDGIASGINLDNGFFLEAATNILYNKDAATRRSRSLGKDLPKSINSETMARSHCPIQIGHPYGSRTRLGSSLAVCLSEPRMYFTHLKGRGGLRISEEERLWNDIRTTQEPVSLDSTILFPPYIVMCHNTRYRPEVLTGITKILGFGKFGEIATITLEEATPELLNECDIGRTHYTEDEIIAEYNRTRAAAVIRVYPKTTPGKRSPKSNSMLISPEKELEINIEKITKQARDRYNV